jgi:hypothetical protein
VSRILYRLIATLARLAFRSGRSKDLEIIVLRHQLAVVRRQIDRPALNDDDRTLLGAIAAALPPPKAIGMDRHTRHPAALAPSPHRPPLDTTLQKTRTTINRARDPTTRSPPRRREPDPGLPPYAR